MISIRSLLQSLSRITIDTVLAAHGTAAVGYWWLSPKGFPFWHARFWLNSALPIVVFLASLLLIVLHHRRPRSAGIIVLGVTVAWATASIYGNWVFPFSLRGVWTVGLAALLVGTLFTYVLHRHAPLQPICLPFLVVPIAVAMFCVRAQQAPSPTTTPLNAMAPLAVAPATDVATSIDLPGSARFYPYPAELVMQRGPVRLNCEPLLNFDGISPDGCWSVLSAVQGRLRGQSTIPPPRQLASHEFDADVEVFGYSDNSVVTVSLQDTMAKAQLAAFSKLDETTHSHLNSFCVFTIRGQGHISLAFSPCPEQKIDVFPSDYPMGRPARFAYWDAEQKFRVVEATSGEKGPFQTLAFGQLERGEPLSILVYDEGEQVSAITLDDWSAQASTDLSPTAGWGVSMNAIEFFQLGEQAHDPVAIYVTLAGTSVGRGWDTVGHASGTYRNRMRIEFVSR